MNDMTRIIVISTVCFGLLFGFAALMDRRSKRDRPEGISPIASAMLLFVALEFVLFALAVHYRTLIFVWIAGGLCLALYIYRRITSVINIIRRIIGKQN
jgi:hypothetical protein